MKRLYNTHPTMAFVKFYDSRAYIFQPKDAGEWKLVRHTSPAKTRRGKAVAVTLQEVSKKKMPNWLDVPDVLAKIILSEGMKDVGPDGEPTPYFHGGHIKELEAIQASIDAEMRSKEARVKELDVLLKKKEAEARVLDRELDVRAAKKA